MLVKLLFVTILVRKSRRLPFETTILYYNKQFTVCGFDKRFACIYSNDVVTIPDTALKSYLNKKLSQPEDSPITEEQLNKFTAISLDIEADNTSITNFAPILTNKSLKYLILRNNSTLTDDNFPNLNDQDQMLSLTIDSTKVSDKIFTKLQTLYVQFDGISDFRPINHFKSLENLFAYGQNITSSRLTYNQDNETLFIPFSLMPNRLTNFDDYEPPFSTSNSSSNTYFTMNGNKIDGSRLSSDKKFLEDIKAKTDDGTKVTSDFNDNVLLVGALIVCASVLFLRRKTK